MKNIIVYTISIIIIMMGLVPFSTIGPASGNVDLNATDSNSTELRQLQPRQNLSETGSLEEHQQMILPIPIPIPIPTHSDVERIVMAIKMALKLEPGSDMQEYSLLRIQEILEDNFTFADGYTVNVNYTNGTGTEAEKDEVEDTKIVEKTLSFQVRKQDTDGSNINKE
jgi:hypothetical protein